VPTSQGWLGVRRRAALNLQQLGLSSPNPLQFPYLLAVGLGQLGARDGDELSELVDLLGVVLAHRALVALHLRERTLHLQAPVDLVDHENDLRGPVEEPVLARLGRVRLDGLVQYRLELEPHLVDDCVHVVFHLAVERQRRRPRALLHAHARHDAHAHGLGAAVVHLQALDSLEALGEVRHHALWVVP